MVNVFASNCESHSVGFFILVYDVAYYAGIGDIAVLGDLFLVDEEHMCLFPRYLLFLGIGV